MRNFPITFLFIISETREVEVVRKNLKNLQSQQGMQYWDAVFVVDESKGKGVFDMVKDLTETVDFTEGYPILKVRFENDFGKFKTEIIKQIKEEGLFQPYLWICDGDEIIPTKVFPKLYQVMKDNHSVNDNEAIAFPRVNNVSWESETSAYQDREFVSDQFRLMKQDHENNPNVNRPFNLIDRGNHAYVQELLYPDYQLRLFNTHTLEGFDGKVHEQPITKNHYRYAVNLGDIWHHKTLDERILSNTLYHQIIHGGEG